MPRIFKITGEGKYEEVDTNDRLASLGDAYTIAQKENGEYLVDELNGHFREFVVANNQVQPFAPDSYKQGAPSRLYDAQTMKTTTENKVSQFGGIFPGDDSPNNRRHDPTESAVEDIF